MDVSISGTCDPAFEAVRDAFIENFSQRGDIGASVAVVIDGKPVVDLWGGWRDAGSKLPWERDTLVNVWSLGKAMSAIALLKLMEEYDISPDDTVAAHWPEFAAGDKDEITFRQIMSHQAGLCAIEETLPANAFFDWELMTGALARQQPWWPPGSAHGYHTNTIGFLMGEPIRRVAGKRLRDYFEEKVARPLGVDFFMGVPDSELSRCADLVTAPRPEDARSPAGATALDSTDKLEKMRYCIYNNPSLASYDFNSAAWRRAEFPSTSPQSNARSVATVFAELAAIVAGKRSGILDPSLLRSAIEIQSDGEDLNVQRPTRFGLGFQLTQPVRPLGPNPHAFGHYGNGGHVGFADPDTRLGFAYHMNHQGYAWRDPRNLALIDATYACL